MKRPIAKGEYYLMPFAGGRLENLVKVVRREVAHGPDFWRVRYVRTKFTTTSNLSACRRVSPSVAATILKQLPCQKKAAS
jgi:hypothetical protein